MARKGGSRQLKREPAPGFWPIKRKERTWAPNTRPGPHSRGKSLPLVIIIREILGYARTAKEATRIISTGKVKIDGVVRRDHRFPVGLMDVLQVEGAGQIFRILPKPNRGLTPTPISEKEAGFKLCKIIGKNTTKTPGTHTRPKIVKIETGSEAFDTPAEYVIPVGTQASLVGLGEKWN